MEDMDGIPDLTAFRGRTVVVKLGGSAMADRELLRTFAQDVARLHRAGVRLVVTHGGGPQINAHLEKLGLPVTFTAGLRVTTPETMDVVRMVLAGQVQRDLVGLLNEDGPLAVGITGEDARLLTAAKRLAVLDGAEVDIGLVGDVTGVDTHVLRALTDSGLVPLVTGIGRGTDGQVYNINADSAAAALAAGLRADHLVILTDVPGLYADWPRRNRIVERLTVTRAAELLPALSGGMAPKLESCLRAVRAGVGRAQLLDGRVPHALLHGSFGTGHTGTSVVPDPPHTPLNNLEDDTCASSPPRPPSSSVCTTSGSGS